MFRIIAKGGQAMYVLLRILPSAAFVVGIFPDLRKSKVRRKKLLFLSCALAALLLQTVLSIFPFENLFYTFPSPQAAYNYAHMTRVEPDLIVEGCECDLIVVQDENGTDMEFIPKTSKGWKIGTGFDSSSKEPIYIDGVLVIVYQFRKTEDFFITVEDMGGGPARVSDIYGTSFVPLEKNYWTPFRRDPLIEYYARIPSGISQYSLTVNGQVVTIPLWEEANGVEV